MHIHIHMDIHIHTHTYVYIYTHTHKDVENIKYVLYMYIKHIYKSDICIYLITHFFQDVRSDKWKFSTGHYGRFFTGSMNRQKDEDLSDGIIANKMYSRWYSLGSQEKIIPSP